MSLLDRRRTMMTKGESVNWEDMLKVVVNGYGVDIIVPDGTSRIRAKAFANMGNMETCVLPSSVTSIQADAFSSCSKLKHLVIPSGVTSIGNTAFNLYNSNCEYFILESTTPPTLSNSNAFSNTGNCPIYVPDSAVATYKAASKWEDLAARITSIENFSTT